MARTYATVEDLPAPAPANATTLLVRASRDVDSALLCARYDPADPATAEALRLAVVEQVVVSLDQGDKAGTGGRRGGFSIGKISVQAQASGDQPPRIGRLWESAWQILQQAGLTGHGPCQR